jgi:hypothetical protein
MRFNGSKVFKEGLVPNDSRQSKNEGLLQTLIQQIDTMSAVAF